MGLPQWALNRFKVHRLNLETEAGIEVPVTVIRPTDGYGYAGILVALDDSDKESLLSDSVVQEALRRDYLVVELDPRGFGELSLTNPGWVYATSLLIGDNLVRGQALDITTVLESFSGNKATSGLLAVYARGPQSSLAAIYAVITYRLTNLRWAVMKNSYVEFEQFLGRRSAERATSTDIPYSFLGWKALQANNMTDLLSRKITKSFFIDAIEPNRIHKGPNVDIVTVDDFIANGW
jgi:hypothetical protein